MAQCTKEKHIEFMLAWQRQVDAIYYREVPMTKKKLYRSRENRMIAGVCGGLGDYFDIDPTLIRLAAVFFSLWWGGGVLLYLLAWFIIPEAPESSDQMLLPFDQTDDGREPAVDDEL